MKFKSFADAIAVVNELADVMKTERHHAKLTILNTAVSLTTNTHSAYVFRSNNTDPKDTQNHLPGVTHRDVRFAIFAERIWQEYERKQHAQTSSAVS